METAPGEGESRQRDRGEWCLFWALSLLFSACWVGHWGLCCELGERLEWEQQGALGCILEDATSSCMDSCYQKFTYVHGKVGIKVKLEDDY